MGLCIDQDIQDGPETRRTKRSKISSSQYLFRNWADLEADPSGGEHSSDLPHQDNSAENSSSPLDTIVNTSPSVEVMPDESNQAYPLTYWMNILRGRLDRVSRRRRRMRQRRAQFYLNMPISAQSRPMIRQRPAHRLLREDRAAGRLRRMPSVHFRPPAHPRETENTHGLGFQPTQHQNSQFIVRSDEEDGNWNDTTSEIRDEDDFRRRREIIQRLGIQLRETRRRMFEDSGVNFYDHEAFLRTFGSQNDTDDDNINHNEHWKLATSPWKDVGCTGLECFAMGKERKELLEKTCIEIFGHSLPSGVIFHEPKDTESKKNR